MKITEKFRDYLSEKVPQKLSNVLFQMFNGIETLLSIFDNKIEYLLRERNILTATNIASLRHLASQNGFEPQLMVPAKGILKIKINSKLFTRVGYPLYLKPNAVFVSKFNKLEYHYNSKNLVKLTNDIIYIPVVEGVIKQTTVTGDGDYIQPFYFSEANIAEDSIRVTVGDKEFVQVKTFFDNEGLNDNRQFILKFSNDNSRPIIIYIQGLELEEVAEITYRLTAGENGNIESGELFECDDIVDTVGQFVAINDDEIEIINEEGFKLGSNGTDINYLKTAIGYNHSQTVLYDNQSYHNFISKFSQYLIQKIDVVKSEKQINHIYISRKNGINAEMNTKQIIDRYKEVITKRAYKLSDEDLKQLSEEISDKEYCLSSHRIYQANTKRYAIEIIFVKHNDIEKHRDSLSKIIYEEFFKFLHIANYTVDFRLVFDKYKNENNTEFDFHIFAEGTQPNILIDTITSGADLELTNRGKEINKFLPLLSGDFEIETVDDMGQSKFVKLFDSIIFASEIQN